MFSNFTGLKFTIIFSFLTLITQAQLKIFGRVYDSKNKAPMAFASIGLLGKSYGTLSNENGFFELIIKNENSKDSIRISNIGYKPFTMLAEDYIKQNSNTTYLEEEAIELDEVIVNSTKIKYKQLGAKKYSVNNCSGFVKNETNWKGSEAAINAENKIGRFVLVENFSFYVIKNLYTDSIKFRLKFYEASEKNYPRYKLIMKKPVYFKVAAKQGEVIINLKDYNITSDKNFFVSLECLENEIDISKFCYAGSYGVPSFVKTAAFAPWIRTRGGGADFKIKVSYSD